MIQQKFSLFDWYGKCSVGEGQYDTSFENE